MNKKIALIGIILSISFNMNNAIAGLIQSDYLKHGDNLAVYDEATNLTWLDLSVTDGNPYEADISIHDGFNYATSQQVIQLFSGFFGSSVTFESQGYSEGNTLLSNQFFSLFGPTSADSSFGFFFDKNNKYSLAGASLSKGKLYAPDFTSNYARYYHSGNSGVGLFLVKKGAINIEKPIIQTIPAEFTSLAAVIPTSSVSEPSTIVIFTLGIILLASCRFKKQP